MHQPSKKDPFLQKVEHLVLSNLSNEEFSIDFVCEEIRLSRSQLHRKIKDKTGISTSIFIRNIRLHKAKEILENTTLNISEISYEVGFSTPQDLSKYFSKKYGSSPTAYRKSYLSSDIVEENESATLVTSKQISHDQSDWNEKFFTTRTMFIGVALISLILLSMSLYNFVSKRDIKTQSRQINNPKLINQQSIAVLPFKLFGPDSLEKFNFGLMEDILTNLTYFEELKVISRTSSERYKDTQKDMKQIGKELEVQYLLEGSVLAEEKEVMITAQLIDSSLDKHVWAKKYRGTLRDFFDLQDNISTDIAELLGQQITDEARRVIDYSKQDNLEARREFLMGEQLILERTREALELSIEYFDKALKIDPNYSDAMLGKAEAFNLINNIYKDGQLYHANGKIYALEAIRNNPYNGMAHALLANSYRDEYDWQKSYDSFQEALHLSPNNAIINYWYSLLWRQLGEADKAIFYSDKAKQLDPLYPVILAGHIVNCAYAGKKEMADECIKETLNILPNSWLITWVQGISAECFEEYADAIKYYERAIKFNPDLHGAKTSIIYCKGKLGDHSAVQKLIDPLDRNDDRDILNLAYLFAGMNEMDSSLYYLDKSVDRGSLHGVIKIYPRYEKVRHTQKFKQIVAKLDTIMQ